jgi:hypothetical protein
MLYKPDFKYGKSEDLLEHLLKGKELSRSMRGITDEEKIELLVYNIIKKEEDLDLQRERLREYQSVFDAMSKFITPKGPTVYK